MKKIPYFVATATDIISHTTYTLSIENKKPQWLPDVRKRKVLENISESETRKQKVMLGQTADTGRVRR